jgi:hypothetical protein
MKTPLILLAAGAILLACSSDNSTGPDPRNCTAGTIGDNQTRTGHLGAASCTRYDWEYRQDSMHYVSYDVQLQQGKGYLFNLQNDSVTVNWDAVLELAGTDVNTGEEQLLLVSDDEGPMNFSQMYFIAPASGTYSLRVMGYDMVDTANYVLQSRRCDPPIGPVTDTLNAPVQTLALGGCVLEKPEFADDSTYMQLYTIDIGPNETKTITVSSNAFNPGFQIFGPGWGQSCGYGYQGCGGAVEVNDPEEGVSTVDATLTADGQSCCSETHLQYPGSYTLAVGGSQFGDVGQYSVQVANGASVPEDISPSIKPFTPTMNPALRFLTRKPVHKRPSTMRAVKHH